MIARLPVSTQLTQHSEVILIRERLCEVLRVVKSCCRLNDWGELADRCLKVEYSSRPTASELLRELNN